MKKNNQNIFTYKNTCPICDNIIKNQDYQACQECKTDLLKTEDVWVVIILRTLALLPVLLITKIYFISLRFIGVSEFELKLVWEWIKTGFDNTPFSAVISYDMQSNVLHLGIAYIVVLILTLQLIKNYIDKYYVSFIEIK